MNLLLLVTSFLNLLTCKILPSVYVSKFQVCHIYTVSNINTGEWGDREGRTAESRLVWQTCQTLFGCCGTVLFPTLTHQAWYQWCRSSHGWGHALTQEYDNLICGTNATDFNWVFVVGDAMYQGQCTSRRTRDTHASYADWIKKNLPADIESTDIKIYNS